jgi:signal transduction histidine kinase
LEAGWHGNPPDAVDLHPIIAQLRDAFAHAAQEKHTELVANLPNRLPEVWADPEQVMRILTILVDNAVNYTTNGRVAISARETGNQVQIAVSDTGPGIPPEALDLIFEPFRRSDVGTTRKHGGAGLGLAVAKRMAELQGGAISVNSRLGAGSTFWVTLPAATARPVARLIEQPRFEGELVAVGAPAAPQRPETRVIEYPRLG